MGPAGPGCCAAGAGPPWARPHLLPHGPRRPKALPAPPPHRKPGPRAAVGLKPAQKPWDPGGEPQGQKHSSTCASASASVARAHVPVTPGAPLHRARACLSSLFQPLLCRPPSPPPRSAGGPCQAEVGRWPQLKSGLRAVALRFCCWA